MKVRCAICGYEDYIYHFNEWFRHPHSIPEVWICDVHRSEFVEWINARALVVIEDWGIPI